MGVLILLVAFLILVSSAASKPASKLCDPSCLQKPRATYYENSPYAFSQGACGYGTYKTQFDVRDHFAGATKSIYEKGAGCGRCYQVKCTNKTICSEGVNVTLTDQIIEGHGAFVLSKTAFKAMAKTASSASALFKQGHVAIQYKRVSCNYGNKKMMIWVEASSKKYNGYLAIKFLYRGGKTDFEKVQVATATTKAKNWVSMNRNYGAVWDTSTVPSGPLEFQFVVTENGIANTKGLPANWKKGHGYFSDIQFFTFVESCKICG